MPIKSNVMEKCNWGKIKVMSQSNNLSKFIYKNIIYDEYIVILYFD